MTPGLSLDFRNRNSLWCSVMVEALARCGVAQAVISPGSRSTPITMALAASKRFETIPVLDERSASFFALGLSRQHRRPTVLVCTSGTAGANYFPAVIEAQESGISLIVITADRPPEMRDCSSGQTIDQHKLFGPHVNWSHELAVPEAKIGLLSYLRQTVAHAVERALLPEPGPVHLNAPFRDPLAPVADDGEAAMLREQLDERFFSHLAAPIAAKLGAALPLLPNEGRGLIVAGPSQPANPGQYAGVVELLSHNTGWPVLAESLSPLRTHAAHGQPFVFGYDVLARNKSLMQKLKPDFILSLGGWPISKNLRDWISNLDVPVWIVSERTKNFDALHNRARSFRADVEAIATTLPNRPTEPSYSLKWTQADEAARGFIEEKLTSVDWLFEGKAAWMLSKSLPAETPVFVANSMPVRDLEYFWAPSDRACPIFFNRGANGIDGTLSTALGVAHGGKPAVLLTGDLALLHDTNGFLLGQKFCGSLTIVLINNHGGGIFEHLPVSQFDPPFEEYFATPQKADFEKLSAAYGVEYHGVKDWMDFERLVSALPAVGIRVLEICTDRKRDSAYRKQILAEAAEKAAISADGAK